MLTCDVFCVLLLASAIALSESQVREQESAVARHQAVLVNRRLAEIKQQKACLKAAAMMEVAMGYSDQLNSALLQLGTGHEHAFEAAEKQKVVVQRHVERTERLAAKAEYRGSEALKVHRSVVVFVRCTNNGVSIVLYCAAGRAASTRKAARTSAAS